MDKFIGEFLQIINAAFTGKPVDISSDFDYERALGLAEEQALIAAFYYGAIAVGINHPVIQEAFFSTCKQISVSERQMYELKRLCKAFDEAGIDYMPVKGSLLKEIFPKPEMRFMSDADILIRTEQYEKKIRPLMLELGYKPGVESNHEFVWNISGLHLELHKRLIPSYNKDYYAYFGDGWRLAKPQSETRYAMNPEDELIYIFTHFAKHYRDAGIGLKNALDIWVFLNAHPSLNHSYIIAELEKLKLAVFYQNMLQAFDVWFAGGISTEVTEQITAVVFNSGLYGTKNSQILSGSLKLKCENPAANVRTKSFFRRIFPGYEVMRSLFPFLKKAPFLLPFMWIFRWFRILFFQRKKISSTIKDVQFASDDRIDDYQRSLNMVGLDFNFSEE